MSHKKYGDDFLGVVCDGMGGMSAGEIASSAAIDTLMEYADCEMPLQDPPEFLKKAAIRMDEHVASLLNIKGEKLQAGTTAVVVYITGSSLYWMSVGDSKIYIIRNHEMVQVTRPHNYQLLLEQSLSDGSISREEYEKESARKEALISYLGMDGLRMMDLTQQPFELHVGDVVLLCSDGLYKSLKDEEIQNLIEVCEDNFMKTADVLIDMAMEYGRGPLDNCSVLLVKYSGMKLDKMRVGGKSDEIKEV